MKKLVTGSIILFVMLLAATAHLAATTPDERPVRETLSPMMQEIHAALQRSNAAVLVLQRELEATAEEKRALELLRAIALEKQEAEISVLRVQQRYARRNGNLEAAAQIENAIGKILHPDPITPNAEALQARKELRTGGRDHD